MEQGGGEKRGGFAMGYRGGYRGGHSSYLGSNGLGVKQPTKRQRISNGSAGSLADTSKSNTDIDFSLPPALSLEQFRALNADAKLEHMFLYLQGLAVTNQRLYKAERVLSETHNTGQVNKNRINLLA